MDIKDMKQLTASTQECLDKIKVSLAAYADAKPSDPTVHEYINSCLDSMYSSLNYIHQRIDNLGNNVYDYQYKHNEGHLPKLTPGGMKKLIKAAGQEDDFEVAKRVIYANKNGAFEADLVK